MRRKPSLLQILKGKLYAKEQDILTQEDGDSSNFTRRMPDQRNECWERTHQGQHSKAVTS